MYEQVEEAVATLQPVVAKVGDEPLDGAEAVWLVNAFAAAEKLCAAGRALAMREVAKTDAWVGDGSRSPEAWMAAEAGIPLGQAIATMEMVDRLCRPDGSPLRDAPTLSRFLRRRRSPMSSPISDACRFFAISRPALNGHHVGRA